MRVESELGACGHGIQNMIEGAPSLMGIKEIMRLANMVWGPSK